MVIALGLIVVGAAATYVGARLTVRGAAAWAGAIGISAFAVGALSFGVDLEGLGAVVVSAGRAETEIAGGAAFGTVLFLFSAAFGAALLVSPAPIPSPPPVMVAAPAMPLVGAALSIYDRFVDRTEAILLLVLYAVYVTLVVRHVRGRRREEAAHDPKQAEIERAEPDPARPRALPHLLLMLAGLGVLYLGATALVVGASRFAVLTTLSLGFVGAAVVGVLTSLDEVLLEVLPVRRGVPELATGNLFGTLAAFCSGVLGVAALVRPLDLDGGANAAFLGMAFLYGVVGTVFMVRGRAGRVLGGFVLAFFAAWLVVTSTV